MLPITKCEVVWAILQMTDNIQNSGGKNVSLDIISISDIDSMFSDSPETVVETKTAATPSPAPTHIGTVIVIEDVAFVM